jgi:hypothetical protein
MSLPITKSSTRIKAAIAMSIVHYCRAVIFGLSKAQFRRDHGDTSS